MNNCFWILINAARIDFQVADFSNDFRINFFQLIVFQLLHINFCNQFAVTRFVILHFLICGNKWLFKSNSIIVFALVHSARYKWYQGKQYYNPEPGQIISCRFHGRWFYLVVWFRPRCSRWEWSWFLQHRPMQVLPYRWKLTGLPGQLTVFLLSG